MRYMSVSALSVMVPAHQVAAIAARSRRAGHLAEPSDRAHRRVMTPSSNSGHRCAHVARVRSPTAVPRATAAWTAAASASPCSTRASRNSTPTTSGSTARPHASRRRSTSRRPATPRSWARRTGLPASTPRPRSIRAASRCSSTRRGSTRWPSTVRTATATAPMWPASRPGRGYYQANDSTGIAPNADIYDVKVLDANGYGQTSDVLRHRLGDLPRQGIQHPRDEPEPGGGLHRELADRPAGARGAQRLAAGITVVVAAGNFGQDAAVPSATAPSARRATTRR
jgi:subtilisin family serine protease